jgi:hypothetical protein
LFAIDIFPCLAYTPSELIKIRTPVPPPPPSGRSLFCERLGCPLRPTRPLWAGFGATAPSRLRNLEGIIGAVQTFSGRHLCRGPDKCWLGNRRDVADQNRSAKPGCPERSPHLAAPRRMSKIAPGPEGAAAIRRRSRRTRSASMRSMTGSAGGATHPSVWRKWLRH